MRLKFGEFILDGGSRLLLQGRGPVHLTPKALELLELLVEGRPRAFSKSEIHERLWPEIHVSDASLPVLVHELREALRDDRHEPNWIRTVPRYGYAFCGDAQPDPEDPAAWECRLDCRILWGVREVLLRPGDNVIGRTREAAVRIDDASVSRRHAVIRVLDTGATLEDCHSHAGTFRRGQRVNGPTPLADGDELALGKVQLTVRVSPRERA